MVSVVLRDRYSFEVYDTVFDSFIVRERDIIPFLCDGD
jgi:hypothetical protein